MSSISTYTELPRQKNLRLGWTFLFASALLVGALLVGEFRLWVTLTSLLVLYLALRNHSLLGWDLFLLVLAGAMLFDYGFANLGISSGPVPIPFSDLVLGILLVFAGRYVLRTDRHGLPLGWLLVFFLVGVLRLIADFPEWRNLAIRDFTLALEATWLVVGYWAARRYSLNRWIKGLTWLFIVGLAYLLLYPFRDTLVALSPNVGLQRPVSLIGTYSGGGLLAAAGFFFFLVLRPVGRVSLLLAASFLPLLFVLQVRAIYLACIAAIVVLFLSTRRRTGGQVRGAIGAVIVVGVLASALLLPLAPEGRLGKATPEFIASQIATLAGQEGPGSGSLRHRIEFIQETLDKVQAQDYGWVVGVGLGPDLAGGFQGGTEFAVRKPHDDYLEVFARMGIVGLVAFLGLIGTSFWRVLRASRRMNGTEARFLTWIVAMGVVYLLVAATQPLLAYPHGTIPLFSLLGAGIAVAGRASTRVATDTEPGRSVP